MAIIGLIKTQKAEANGSGSFFKLYESACERFSILAQTRGTRSAMEFLFR
jgi:hypothetical protein